MTQPHIDTDYQLEHFVSGPLLPDLEFLYQRISDTTVETVAEVRKLLEREVDEAE